MKNILTAALLAMFAAPGLAAQTAQKTPGHIQAAEALLDVMDIEQMLRRTTEMRLSLPGAPHAQLAPVEDILREFLQSVLSWESLRAEYVELYSDLYTEAELREMYGFYRTPLGQRMIATLPELMFRSGMINQRRMEAHLPELMRRLQERGVDSGVP